MSLEGVVAAAAEDGLPVGQLLLGIEPGAVPPGPSGFWALANMPDGSYALGGKDRGRFALYGRYFDDEAALNALRHVFAAPLEQTAVDEVERRRLSEEAQTLAATLQADGHPPLTPADVPVGTALDRLGGDSGHVLFLYDTPFGQRSSPPTDLELPRQGWLLRQPLPETARVERVVPWFGQAGGGVMVTLDRPVRFYYDTRVLDAFGVS